MMGERGSEREREGEARQAYNNNFKINMKHESVSVIVVMINYLLRLLIECTK
jgi:hypothetical protein